MVEGSNTIRFKRGDIEFELSGSATDIAKAWTALEGSVVSAFNATAAAQPRPEGAEEVSGQHGEKKRRSRRRSATGGGGNLPPSDDTRAKVMAAELENFPELGSDPSASMVGFAVLRWARDKVGADELTVQDIHAVAVRLGIPHGVNAYREAFRSRARAVHKTTKTPQTYKLMNPGVQALGTYLASMAAGGSADEAEEKAAAAEAKAKE